METVFSMSTSIRASEDVHISHVPGDTETLSDIILTHVYACSRCFYPQPLTHTESMRFNFKTTVDQSDRLVRKNDKEFILINFILNRCLVSNALREVFHL